MELPLKSKSIKKKHKKKKKRISENELIPLIKPNLLDGVCNWVRLQKVMEVSEKKKDKEESSNESKTNQFLYCTKPSFYCKSKKESLIKSEENVTHPKNDSVVTTPNTVKVTPKKDTNQPHRFGFNGSANISPKKSSQETKNTNFSEKRLTKAVAMDCEMVGTGPKGETSMIARVSIVNAYGVCLYDEFVKPKEKVTDYRTKISGVRPADLKKGKDLFEVQKDVLNIIEGRILVGHSIKHDLDVLFLSHPRHLIRDTSLYKPFRQLCGGKTPSLKKLTSIILGCEIQSGEHSSVQDALATMLLYLRQREEWEAEINSYKVEDAQAAMLLYLREKKEWERQVKSQRRRKPKIIENQAES